MTDRLHQMLAPDERVIYRSRYGVLGALRFLTVFAAIGAILWFGVTWTTGLDLWDSGEFIFLVLFMLIYYSVLAGTTTAVITDRRILYKSGVFRPQIVEMDLRNIDRVDEDVRIPGISNGKIVGRTGEDISVEYVWNGGRFFRVLREQAELDQPLMASGKVRVWVYLIGVIGSLSGLSFGLWAVYEIFSQFEAYAPRNPISIPLFLLVLPSLIVGMLGGMWVSIAVLLCLARPFLSVDEARETICNGLSVLGQETLMGRLGRLFVWPLERVVGWLYGQRIRCEEE